MASSDFGQDKRFAGMRNGHAKLTPARSRRKSARAAQKAARLAKETVRAEGLSIASSVSSEKTTKKRAARGVRVERRLTVHGTESPRPPWST